MTKAYESMTLKEIFLAGKKKGIVVPVHLRGADVANNPKALEEARQYLVTQLNALYLKTVLRNILWVAVLILAIVTASLTVAMMQYLRESPAKTTTVQQPA